MQPDSKKAIRRTREKTGGMLSVPRPYKLFLYPCCIWSKQKGQSVLSLSSTSQFTSYSCYGCCRTTRTMEDKSMAYSIMVWLVDPGEQAHQQQAMQRTTTTRRANAPGAESGVNEPPAFTRMLYGVYESLEEAKEALSEISNALRGNEPLQSGRELSWPLARVHQRAPCP